MRTFENTDKLHRQGFANKLTKIIENSNDYDLGGSLVISLDSAWGTGKSTFIEMWGNDIKTKYPNIKIISYNAWENDDWDNALIPLIDTILKHDIVDKEN
jgi:predicted KAP-like P-loop ATPase